MADAPQGFKDREEFLDGLFDHIFGEDEVSEEDHSWFEDKVASFFAKLEGEKPPGRRRSRGQAPTPPARRSGGGRGTERRSKGSSGYGLSMLYGDKENRGA